MKVSVIVKKNKDSGLVMVRLSHAGERKYISIGHVNMDDWDAVKLRSKKRDSAGLALNANIERTINELNRKIFRLQTLNMKITMERVLDKEIKSNRLSEYIDGFVEEYEKSGRPHSAKLFKAVLKRVEKHDVNIGLIDDKWINGFIHKMIEDKLGNTAQHTYIRVCKIVLNKCVRDGIINRNPLLHVKIKKDPVFKSKLTMEELQSLKSAKGLSYQEQMALDTFMLAFYMYGSRCQDVIMLKRNQVKDGRIYLRQSKTNKILNIKVTPEISELLKKYPTSTYVLPWFENKNKVTKREILNFSAAINYKCNKGLKDICTRLNIEKHVTMHVARHTFAVMANRMDIRVTDIQKLLNHGSLSITEQYLNELGMDEHLDNEAAKIFSGI
jgi:integrase